MDHYCLEDESAEGAENSARRATLKQLTLQLQNALQACVVLPGEAKPSYFPLKYLEGCGDLKPFATPHKPTKSEFERWSAEGYMPVWPPGAKRHPHALLGAGRALAEQEAIRLASDYAAQLGRSIRLIDVGSNAERLRAAVKVLGLQSSFAEIHHLVPVIQVGDSRRLLATRGRYAHCECKYELCPHLLADVHLFQHSLYYFTPDVLLERIPPGGLGLATLHHIFGAAGSLEGGQLVYHVREDGMVEALAKGNAVPYVHHPNGWLQLPGWSDGTRTLHWECVADFFSSFVYKFWVVNGVDVPPRPPPTWDDPMSHGDVSADFLARVNENLKPSSLDRALGVAHYVGADAHVNAVDKITLKYGVAYAYTGPKVVVAIPTDLVGVLSARAAGVERTPTLFRTLTELGRRYLLAGNHPPKMIGRCLLLACVAAMARGVEEETARVGRLYATHAALFEQHRRALSGEQVAVWHWWRYFDPRGWWACCRTDTHQTDEASVVLQLRDGGVAATVTHPTVLPPHKFAPVYTRKTMPEPVQSPDSRVRVGHDTMKRPPTPSARLSLIALGPFVPTTADNDEDSIVHAFKTRLGREVPQPMEGVWESLNHRRHVPHSVLHGLQLDPIHPTDEERAAWLHKFPEQQRAAFIAAQAELKRRGLTASDLRGSAMIKVEKSGMVTSAGPPAIDERIVIAYKPIRQVATGVFDWLAAKQVRKNYSMTNDSPNVWVNGRDATAELFGEWFVAATEAIAQHGEDVNFYVGDQNKFEAHRSEQSFMFEKDVIFEAVDDPDYRAAKVGSMVLKGRAQRVNVSYMAKWVLGSGVTETSFSSLMRNLGGLVHTFGEPSWGVMVFAENGDDWLVITSRHFTPEYFHTKMLEAGLESDFRMTRTIADVEFCQTIPYPVAGTVVWGPKIGRTLSRLPFSTTSTKDDPRGVALGMAVACNHIPFVSDYLRHIALLSPGVDAIRYDHHIAARHPHVADDSTMAFVYERYGLTNDDLLEFRSLLSTVGSLQCMVFWPHLARLVERDE